MYREQELPIKEKERKKRCSYLYIKNIETGLGLGKEFLVNGEQAGVEWCKSQ
jgi:hypothetical protein